MTLLTNEHCRTIEANGTPVIRFGFGQSPFPPVPTAVEAHRGAAQRKEYAHVQGLPELRNAIAKFHTDVDGGKVQYDPNGVFVGPGLKQLILNLFLCFRHVNVYVPAPAWVSYAPQAAIAGHPVVRVNASAPTWRVTAAELEVAFRSEPSPGAPKLLIFNNPGNPDGCCDTLEELQAIVDVCRKHNVLVVADEIYGLLHHKGKHVSMPPLYEKAILATGLSKWLGAGGWRVGVFIFPSGMEDLKNAFTGVASETYSCISTAAQVGATAAYSLTPSTQEYLGIQRRFLGALGRWAARSLRAAGIAVHDPQGGFYLFVDFDPVTPRTVRQAIGKDTANDFFAYVLAETHVALLAGPAFGMQREHFVARLAFVTFDGQKVLDGMRALPADAPVSDTFIAEHAPVVVDGIQRLAKLARKLRGIAQGSKL
jgi:aspartate aminotransferase